MSFALTAHIRALRGLTLPQRAMLYTLADFANEGRECWPSQATLADILGCGVRNVRVLLDGLEAAGLIARRQSDRKAGKLAPAVITVLPGAAVAAIVRRAAPEPAARRSNVPARAGSLRPAAIGKTFPPTSGKILPPSPSPKSKEGGAMPGDGAQAPSSPRLPHDCGGASSVHPAMLTDFQRSRILAGGVVILGGVKVDPDTPAGSELRMKLRDYRPGLRAS